MNDPKPPYRGDQPFAFVCYAHEDKALVYPQIAWLQDQGVNIWYDEGISAGQNWRAVIGDSLDTATHVLFFISRGSLSSEHCNREINLALDEGKAVVPVYLEDVALTADLKVGLNRVQALTCDTSERYRTKLLHALSPCQGEHAPSNGDEPIAFGASYPLRRPGRLRWTAAFIVLTVLGTGFAVYLTTPTTDQQEPAVVAPPSNSVAVLPFDYLGATVDDSYLGPGLSAELRDQLGRVEGLVIAAPSSSIAAARNYVDAKTTASNLGVAHVLEGNLRPQSNVLRVSAQLVDGSSGLVVWSKAFDRDRSELLNVQQEIAHAVANALLPASNPTVARPVTRDTTANEKILLARHYEQQVRERTDVDPELLGRAIELYREAIALDPESALAHSRLAGALMFQGDIDAAEAPAYRALELDPRLAEAQNAWGKYLFVRGRPNMEEPLARAIELNPNLPDALVDYAWWYWYNKNTKGVGELYERARQLDPLNVSRYGDLGSFLALNDEQEAAHALIEQMKRLFSGPDAFRAIAHIYDLLGEVDHAIAWTIRARDADKGNPAHVEKLAEYYIDIGDEETARALTPDLGVGLLYKLRRYDEVIEQAEELVFDYPEDIQLRINLAAAYNYTGRPDLAIRIIRNSGILESIKNAWRGSADYDAYNLLIDAAYARGEIEEARELVRLFKDTHYDLDTSDWWAAIGAACQHAVLGDEAEVAYRFQRALMGRHLVWDPNLKDSACFRRYADDPAYLAVVEHFDGLRAKLRDRLPDTLARYGVAL